MKTLARTLPALALVAALSPPVCRADVAPGAAGNPVIAGDFARQLQHLAGDSATAALASGSPPVRIEVELGALDTRLQLAPCEQIQPYLPTGARATGKTRIGLRCLQGPVKWNVYLPVQVKIFAQAVVTVAALPANTVLEARHLSVAEVDLAIATEPAYTQASGVLGRTLSRALGAGDTLRRNDLKVRQYFQPGDVVRVVAVGQGYAVSIEGQALNAGLEGQPARVRTESGRVLSGMPAGDHRVEIAL